MMTSSSDYATHSGGIESSRLVLVTASGLYAMQCTQDDDCCPKHAIQHRYGLRSFNNWQLNDNCSLINNYSCCITDLNSEHFPQNHSKQSQTEATHTQQGYVELSHSNPADEVGESSAKLVLVTASGIYAMKWQCTQEHDCCPKHAIQHRYGLRSFSNWQLNDNCSLINSTNLNSEHFPQNHSEATHAQQGYVELETYWTKLTCSRIADFICCGKYYEVINIARNIQPMYDLERLEKYFVMGLAHYKLAHYKLVQFHEATFYLTQGVQVANRNLNAHYGDVALFNAYLGDIELATGEPLKAIQYYEKAIGAYLEDIKMPEEESHDVQHKAIAAAHYSSNTVAASFKMAPPSLSAIHAKCGSALRSVSKSEMKAIQHYKTAIDLALTDIDRLNARIRLGNLYRSLRENTEALKEYKELSQLLTARCREDLLGDESAFFLGWAHGNIGIVYFYLCNYDKALYHLNIALDIEQIRTPQAIDIGGIYNNLGTVYQSMNDLAKAEEYYDLALSHVIHGNHNISSQARVYGNIGNLLMLRKEYESAIQQFSEILQLTSDPSILSTAFHNRGRAYYEWAEKEIKLEISNKNSRSTASVTLTDTTPGSFCIHSSNNSPNEYSPPTVPPRICELYKKGSDDLEEVVKHLEETLEKIKGSSKGLSLSVSLFESNSRTFHRLQDCLVRQGKYDRALLVAEQSRARNLGELMLKKNMQLESSLFSPPNLEKIKTVVSSQNSVVVYLSYTGARLLGWVFVPHSDHGDVSMSMFEVPLKDDMFDGKSFDYHVKCGLTEKLVETSFEIYQSVKYDKESSSTVQDLHTLIAKPVKYILSKNGPQYPNQHLNSIVIIPDSYTSLVPFTCLLDPDSGSFLGDHFYFQMMPSLLSLGILSQLPDITVIIPDSPHAFCIIGDPNIPPFHYNGEVVHLGRLPYARREAEWVAHLLKTIPVLSVQATKSTVLMRIMSAKLIHFATHSSATSGFLAFGTDAPHYTSADNQCVEAAAVLLFPKEVERFNISSTLVALSSCDSGRGIQGMANAFILAGAQSVLTTLWSVPDESASVFMKFFYQYLMDGFKSSMALHKAILSIRCFTKYSQFIHWSGYQLTGRDTHFQTTSTPTDKILENRMGPKIVLPHLKIMKLLKSSLIDEAWSRLYTDVQILRGAPGLGHSEIVKYFIHCNYKNFSGGIFWISCRQLNLIDVSIAYIEEVTGKEIDQLPISEDQQALFVFDAITELPNFDKLLKVMRNRHNHIIFISKSTNPPDMLVKQVNMKLIIRDCTIIELEPLSMIESTQHIVHSVMKNHHLTPNNEDQKFFGKLAEFTSGSPVIVEVASKCLLSHFKDNKNDAHEVLSQFSKAILLDLDHKSRIQSRLHKNSRSVSNCELESILTNQKQDSNKTLPTFTPSLTVSGDHWNTNSQYDSWDSIEELIKTCKLTPEERHLLNTVCMFSCSPIPYYLVVEISSLIAMATQQPHIAGTLSYKLQEMCLLKTYPSPVVLHSSLNDKQLKTESEFVSIPQYISRSIWKNLDKCDRVMALSTMFQALLILYEIAKPLEVGFLLGLCGLFLEMLQFEWKLMGVECYRVAYDLCQKYKDKVVYDTLPKSYEPHSQKQKDGKLSYVPVLMLDLCFTRIDTNPLSRPKSDLYSMKSQEHGVALIIVNITVTGCGQMKQVQNENNLVETFRYLGYRVKIRRRYTKDKLDELFDNLSLLIKDADDSFMCCLLSDGGENVVCGSDGRRMALRIEKDSLEKKLTKCKKLNGKPKIVFAPYSHHVKKRPWYQPDSDKEDIIAFYYSPLNAGSNDSRVEHNETKTTLVTFYIDTLCRLLCQTASSRTLSDIHEEVTKEVMKTKEDLVAGSRWIDSTKRQITRQVFFFGNVYLG